MSAGLPREALQAWIAHHRARAEPPWRQGHQGQLLRFREAGWDLVVKCPRGRGVRGWWSRRSLRREYAAYQRLQGIAGVPRCHALLPGDYLVLDHIDTQAYRHAQIGDRSRWFHEFLSLLQQMHRRGVAHGDLKRKANLLVTPQGSPVVVDFGTAWLRRDGWHPLNHRLFDYLARTDLNAYIKHKYHGRYADVSAEDAGLLRYSRLEAWISAWRKWRERRREHMRDGGLE